MYTYFIYIELNLKIMKIEQNKRAQTNIPDTSEHHMSLGKIVAPVKWLVTFLIIKS